jgi:hypothetical protein
VAVNKLESAIQRVSPGVEGRRCVVDLSKRSRMQVAAYASRGCNVMKIKRNLKGRRIAVLAADGFEKVELTVPANALRLSGATCHVISLRHGRIRGVNLHAWTSPSAMFSG